MQCEKIFETASMQKMRKLVQAHFQSRVYVLNCKTPPGPKGGHKNKRNLHNIFHCPLKIELTNFELFPT